MTGLPWPRVKVPPWRAAVGAQRRIGWSSRDAPRCNNFLNNALNASVGHLAIAMSVVTFNASAFQFACHIRHVPLPATSFETNLRHSGCPWPTAMNDGGPNFNLFERTGAYSALPFFVFLWSSTLGCGNGCAVAVVPWVRMRGTIHSTAGFTPWYFIEPTSRRPSFFFLGSLDSNILMMWVI